VTPATAAAVDVLVIGATEMELAGVIAGLKRPEPLVTAWTNGTAGSVAGCRVAVLALGLGKANAAAGLAVAIVECRPLAVLQVGVGGAYVGSFLSVGMAMLADEDRHLDLGLRRDEGWADLDAIGFPLSPARADRPALGAAVPTDPALTATVADATGLPRGRFATLDAVTHDVHLGARLQARFDVSVESMEGAAAAQTADRLRVPFTELRAISNVVGERDRAHWDLRGAVRVVTEATSAALRALAADGRWSRGG
jgi:futalosine hydrolase